jgi:hypothetical protein
MMMCVNEVKDGDGEMKRKFRTRKSRIEQKKNQGGV